ncbi:MAG TPA: ammonium transporter [Pyrinomonadaceae bacterium]|jgi:ammonium transporter, Amt family
MMHERTSDTKRRMLSACWRLFDQFTRRNPWVVRGQSRTSARRYVLTAFAVAILLSVPLVALAGDPTGAGTGNAGAVTAAKPGEPTTQEMADAIGHANISINFVWTLVACFLVMFMQAGFALAETGFTRAKNAAHTMAMNFMCYPLGMLGFWVCGFALMMGGVGAVAALGGTSPLTSAFSINIAGHTLNIFGHKGIFLRGDSYDVGVFSLFMFAMVFMDTAVTIPTGALAERWKWGSFVIYCFFMSMFAYPIFGNWVWGGGWLSQLGSQFGLGHGHVDFAGSSVVHMVGGVAALAGAIVLGPRIGKYGKDGKVNAIPGHHMPMAILGVFILAFGWFGFNAGSSLSGTDLRISVIAVNTMLASAGGAFSAMLVAQKWFGKPDLGLMANGMLAGLVAITAPCAFVSSFGAVVIGLISGVILVGSVYFIEHKLKVDDPVGAISVHGVNGAWGVISLGLFADGTYGAGYNGIATPVIGLFYGGGFSQLIAQSIGTATCFIFIFGSFFVYFKVADIVLGNRVSAEEEIEGLDLAEVGVLAYPDFTLRPNVALGSHVDTATPEATALDEIIPAKAQTSVA